MKTCQYCHITFNINHGQYANHVKNCDLNPRKQEIKEKFAIKFKEAFKSKRKDFRVSCRKCGKEFTVNEIISKHPQKEMYHCSRKCANTRVHSEETKRKMSFSASKTYTKNNNPKYTYTCLFCKKIHKTGRLHLTFRKFCNIKCRLDHNKQKSIKTKISSYREYCKFKFNVFDYPSEFDLDLIKQHGFYYPANHCNLKKRRINLKGISRDHMLSVKFGYENGISPDILSHPANCEIMLHTENSKKNIKCNLTLEQLMIKIELWNKKYGNIAQ